MSTPDDPFTRSGAGYDQIGLFIRDQIPYNSDVVINPSLQDLANLKFEIPEDRAPTSGTGLPAVRGYNLLRRNNQNPGNASTSDVTLDHEKRECLNVTVGDYSYQVTKVLRIPYKWRRATDPDGRFRQSFLLVAYTGPND